MTSWIFLVGLASIGSIGIPVRNLHFFHKAYKGVGSKELTKTVKEGQLQKARFTAMTANSALSSFVIVDLLNLLNPDPSLTSFVPSS